MPKGRCEYCKVVWEWDGKPLLLDARCPHCSGGLNQTTHLIKRFPILQAGRIRVGRSLSLTRTREQGHEIQRGNQ